MDELFLSFLNRAIAAGWLVLAVVVLRPLLRRAPKYCRMFLWGLVFLRLLLPAELIPESPASLVPSAETLPREALYAAQPAIHSGVPAINAAVNPVLQQSLAPNPGDSVNPLQVWTAVGSTVWLIGAAVLLLYMIVSTLLLRRRVAAARPMRDNIWLCAGLSTPFVLGFFRPQIYLPPGMDEERMALVLAHEQGHIARHDHWLKPLAFLLLAAYWFHPLLWLAYVLFCRDMELACDEYVLRTLGQAVKKPYARALVDGSTDERISACPVAFGEGGVKARVKNVLRFRPVPRWVLLALCFGLGILAGLFFTNPSRTEPSTEAALSTEDLTGTSLPIAVPTVDPEAVGTKGFYCVVYTPDGVERLVSGERAEELSSLVWNFIMNGAADGRVDDPFTDNIGLLFYYPDRSESIGPEHVALYSDEYCVHVLSPYASSVKRRRLPEGSYQAVLALVADLPTLDEALAGCVRARPSGGDGTYSYDLFDLEGNYVGDLGTYTVPLSIHTMDELLSVPLIAICGYSGPSRAAHWRVYLDPSSGMLSEAYSNVLLEDRNGIIFCGELDRVCIFNPMSGTLRGEITEFSEPLAPTADSPFLSAEVEQDGTLVVRYLAGEDYHTATDRYQMAAMDSQKIGYVLVSANEQNRLAAKNEMLAFFLEHREEMEDFAGKLKALNDSDPDYHYQYAVEENALYGYDGVSIRAKVCVTEHPVLADAAFFGDKAPFLGVYWGDLLFECDACFFWRYAYAVEGEIYAELFLFYTEDEPVTDEYMIVEPLGDNWYFYCEYKE